MNRCFFLHTCITCNWTRCPVTEWGHDTVLLAGQLAWSHCAWARTVWTPKQKQNLFIHSSKHKSMKSKPKKIYS